MPAGLFLGSGSRAYEVALWDLADVSRPISARSIDRNVVTSLAWVPGTVSQFLQVPCSVRARRVCVCVCVCVCVFPYLRFTVVIATARCVCGLFCPFCIPTLARRTSFLFRNFDEPTNQPTNQPQGSEDLRLRLWDLRANRQPAMTLRTGDDIIKACAVSPDGRYFVTGHNGFDGVGCTVAVFDARKGKLLTALGGHTQAVNSVVALLPAPRAAGLRIVSAANDKSVVSWTAAGAGGTDGQVDTVAFPAQVLALATGQSSSGTSLVAGGTLDGALPLWTVDESAAGDEPFLVPIV